MNLKKITEFLSKHNLAAGNKISIPVKFDNAKFEQSVIAVNPTTKKNLVMASTGKHIIVFSRKGDILAVERFD